MGDRRDYALPPLDELDEWAFYLQWELLADQGYAERMGPRSDGRPSGYREPAPNKWKNNAIITEFSVWTADPINALFIRDGLREANPQLFRDLWAHRQPWFRNWERTALRDPDIVSDSLEPKEIEARLSTWQGAYQLLLARELSPELLAVKVEPPTYADFDPLRAAYGYEQPRPPRLEGLEPFIFQTQREVRVRDAKGKFIKGQKPVIKKIPVLEIPHASDLGTTIRIIDADRTRKAPRGAIARIQTKAPSKGHPGSYQYIVPVIKGTWRGKRLDDPQHRQQRKELKKESVQLYDQRSDQPRNVEVLVTKRSRYYTTAAELQQLVAQAQKQKR